MAGLGGRTVWVGLASAALLFACNNVGVSGAPEQPWPEGLETDTASLVLEPAWLGFEYLGGLNPQTELITLSNKGLAPVYVADLQLQDAGTAWSFADPGPFVLAPGDPPPDPFDLWVMPLTATMTPSSPPCRSIVVTMS